MPKILFYTGTAFCLFVALSSAAGALSGMEHDNAGFIAVGTAPVNGPWAIVLALVACLAIAGIFIRMASLVAARNLFAAMMAVVTAGGSVMALVWVLMLQARMLRAPSTSVTIADLHLASVLTLAYFVSAALLALRPYFRIQASRTLSALVFFPLPLVVLIIAQELFVRRSVGPLPAQSPALTVFYAVIAVLFLSIAIHSVRHRYLFLEMTNLRELLDSRVDPAGRATRRPIGGVAFDS